LQLVQQKLRETRQRAEGAEADLRSERATFDEAKERLEDDFWLPKTRQRCARRQR